MDILDRILARVNVNESTGCWEWHGARDKDGYGLITITTEDDKKVKKVHRVMWMLSFADVDSSVCVLHRCDNPPCCNPDHLFLGTTGDNNRDRNEKGRQARGIKSKQSSLQDDDILMIVARRKAGETTVAIAADYGITDVTVGDIAAGDIWKHVEREALPRQSYRQLTEDDVRKIRQMSEAGKTIAEIANDNGYARHRVLAIVSGRQWKGVL